ncbi:hypothetical protein ANN_22201 [Periplaneta americana]|uniref:Tc1-like transposase DDE domain-containing protein n=1 Tax=Periplaneta americana TaxID=6978 RepID=A0ABQ8S8F6_PERAM|nr:hypothetical protein ANN_22201 [Periplaneta americana]
MRKKNKVRKILWYKALVAEEMIPKDILMELNDSSEQNGMKINAHTTIMIIGTKIKKDIHWNASPFLLQHGTQLDNVSAATMQWYADNNVHRLDWPAQSPDLNPIEHLWDELNRRLRSREMRPTSIVQLSAILQEEWRRIPVDILHKLVESMPDRVAAVILFNDAVSITRLFSVDEIGDSEMVFGEMKPRIRHRLPGIHFVVGENVGKNPTREEHKLRVFENKVLRKIFGAKKDEVTGEWRKLHNTELHALYSSPDIIRNIKSRRLRCAGHVARMGESRNAYRVLVGRPEGKRPLGRLRRRWEDNIKMDLKEVEYDDREWINLAQDRDQWRAYVRAAMNLGVP